MGSDLELLDRWCAGDKSAGSDLFQRHFASVYRFFERKLHTADEVDELVQDTFLACVRSRDRFQRQSSFRTYLFAVARYTLYSYWRKQSTRGNEVDFEDISLANLTTTPGTKLSRNQDRQRLLAALRTLPLESQLLLELHYWQQMDARELAEVFDIAPPTARSRMFRARAALRQTLEAMDGMPDLSDASVGDLDAWARRLGKPPADDEKPPADDG